MLLILVRRVDSLSLNLRINAFSVKWFSAVNLESSKAQDESIFATYLMQNFGVTNYSATKAAKDWGVSKLDSCNAAVAFFKDQGFSDVQVSKLIRVRPSLLIYKPQTMKPKIDFLKSLIPEPSEIHRVISTYPELLIASLDQRLIPTFNSLSNLLESERDATNVVRRAGSVLLVGPEFIRNLAIVKKYGVPGSKLALVIGPRSPSINSNSVLIEEAIVELRKMGFKLNTSLFVIALRVRLTVSKQKWEDKVALFKEFGWPEGLFLLVFRKNPYVATYNIDKIAMTMNYMKELGIEPCRIAKHSHVLGMSFEKRIIPRSSVFKVLVSKGLIRRSISLHAFFCSNENKFVQKYISRYCEVNGLKELYQEKLELSRQTLRNISQ